MAIKYLYILIVLALSNPIDAQISAVELLKKSTETVNSLNTYSVGITMKVFAGSLDGQLIETTVGQLKKSEANMYSELGYITAVQHATETIVIDKENNNIILTENPAAKKQSDFLSIYKDIQPYLDTVIATYSNDNYIGLTCKYKEAFGVFYDKIEMIVNKATYLPEKIILYPIGAIPMYEEELKGRQMILVIEYQNWQLNPSFSASQFDFNNYVYKKNTEWLPSKGFENYEITILK